MLINLSWEDKKRVVNEKEKEKGTKNQMISESPTKFVDASLPKNKKKFVDANYCRKE